MIDAFVEGTRSIVQACHLVILVPVAMLVLAARGRWQASVGAVVGIVLGGWVFATRWLVLDDAQIRWSSLLVLLIAVGLGASFVAERRSPDFDPDARPVVWGAAAAVGVGAFVTTTWWRPCVGSELGDILTNAPDRPWAQLLPAAGFMLGVSLPIVLLGLGLAAWQPGHAATRRFALAGTTCGVVLAASVLAGQHGEIVATLFDWSQPFV